MNNRHHHNAPWFAAFCAVALLGACTSSTPAPKSADSESASSSEVAPTSSAAADNTEAPADTAESQTSAGDKATATETKAAEGEAKKGGAPKDDSRTTASIQKIINDNRPKFKKCYEDERKKNQELKGTVVLELTLDAEGKLKKSGINMDESTIKLKAVTDCMLKVAEGLTYPASSKGLDKDFRYEFGFNNH